MNDKLIVALDQGSSSSRVLALDSRGNVVARASRAVQTQRSSEQTAEIDANALLTEQIAALQEVLSQIDIKQVISLAIASQRSTIVLWDRKTGKPLMPAMSWQDGRATAQTEQVTFSQSAIHQWTGLYKTPFYSAAKIAWALQHSDAVAQAAKENRLCVGPTASYIIWHLTKGRVFACDPTLAQRTLLFNIKTLDWEPELLRAFGIKEDWLPQIQPTTADYGFYEYEGGSLPIKVCVGDQQASLYALQVTDGEACINYGTGGFFMRHTGTQCHLFPGMLTSIAASISANQSAEYLLEGPVNACSTFLAWLNKIGFSLQIEELDELCQTAMHPVWILPALGGLGAPYWDFTASVVITGLTPHTQRGDVAAGALRGLALLMADIVFYTEQFGLKNQDIKVSGGLSQVKSLLQLQADVLQKRLLPCVEKESTAVGAGLLAAEVQGIDTSCWNTLRLAAEIMPRLTAVQAKLIYQQWHGFLEKCKAAKK